MKETLIKLLSSVLKAAALGAIIAGAAYFAHISVLMAFTVSFIGQFVISYLYGSYLEFKTAKLLREERMKELEILARITFNIDCAACKKTNEVVVNPDIDNRFNCVHCKALNSVYLSAESALVTEPIKTENV